MKRAERRVIRAAVAYYRFWNLNFAPMAKTKGITYLTCNDF